METYCDSCNKYTAYKDSSVRNTKQNRLMFLSKCAIYDKKKPTFKKIKKPTNLIIFQMNS